jgi:hypothetical protein
VVQSKVTVTIEIGTCSEVDITHLNKAINEWLKKLLVDSQIPADNSNFSIKVSRSG